MQLWTKIKLSLGATLATVIVVLWAFGGFLGALLSALRNDLVGVVLSIFIPGAGAVITVIAFFRWLF